MNRTLTRCFAAISIVFLSCTTPTVMCGCPPARSSVVVVGTVTEQNGAPVAGARLYFERTASGQFPATPLDIGYGTDTQTDAAGAFRSLVYSAYSPDIVTLRAGIRRAGATDTVWVSAGSATFRYERDSQDTARVMLRLP